MKKITHIAALLARVVIAVLFLYAGLSKAGYPLSLPVDWLHDFVWTGFPKAGDPAAFALAIDRYRVVPHEVALVAALFLPMLEIACAIALFFKKLRAGALALLAACGVVFAALLASALARGLDIACGCFGGNDAATGRDALLASLVRAIVIIAVCAWLLAREVRPRTSGGRSLFESSNPVEN